MILVKKGNKNKFEQGLTLIEASMVLALSAVVIAGAVMYYNSASESNKTQRAQSLLGGIQAGVQSVFATRPNYVGLTSSVLASTSAIPRAFIEAATNTIVNPWGGVVTVLTGNPNRQYTVSFAGVPKGACGPLASADLGNSLVSVAVGTGTTAGTARSPGNATFSQTILADCVSGATSDVVKTITWTFK